MADLRELATVERALHAQMLQRQAAQSSLDEVEHALAHLSDDAYRIVGNIMVKAPAAQLRETLTRRQETLRSRIAGIERQETQLRAHMERLQQAAMGGST